MVGARLALALSLWAMLLQTAHASQPASPTPAAANSAASASKPDVRPLEKAEATPFNPPGYQSRTINGEVVYCKDMTLMDTHIPKRMCFSREAVEELGKKGNFVRGELQQKLALCGSRMGICNSGP